MVCRNAVAFGPPVHRARRDAEDQFARRRVGRACSNTSCPFPARSPGRDAAGMRGATGDRGARRAGRPASTGRRPPGLPRVRWAAGPVGPRPGPAGPPAWWAAVLAAATTGLLCRLRRHPRAVARRLPAPPRGPGGVSRGGAAGRRHRPIANALGVPADTVRGWLRRARRRAPWLRVLATGVAYRADPSLGPIPPRRSVLADAVEALGQAAAALTRRLGVLAASPWQVIAALTGGRLLAPLSPSG